MYVYRVCVFTGMYNIYREGEDWLGVLVMSCFFVCCEVVLWVVECRAYQGVGVSVNFVEEVLF